MKIKIVVLAFLTIAASAAIREVLKQSCFSALIAKTCAGGCGGGGGGTKA